MIAIEIGIKIIIEFANSYAECDNLDDAECIVDQIEGEDLEI